MENIMQTALPTRLAPENIRQQFLLSLRSDNGPVEPLPSGPTPRLLDRDHIIAAKVCIGDRQQEVVLSYALNGTGFVVFRCNRGPITACEYVPELESAIERYHERGC